MGNAMSTGTLRLLSNLCFFGGFASIFVSIAIWAIMRDSDSYCTSGDCKAVLRGSDSYCDTDDSKARCSSCK